MMEWEKEELMDQISAHVKEWHIISDCGTKSAIGTYDDGELITFCDVQDI